MWSVAWTQFINAEEAVGGAQRENTRNHTSKAVFSLRCLQATHSVWNKHITCLFLLITTQNSIVVPIITTNIQ